MDMKNRQIKCLCTNDQWVAWRDDDEDLVKSTYQERMNLVLFNGDELVYPNKTMF